MRIIFKSVSDTPKLFLSVSGDKPDVWSDTDRSESGRHDPAGGPRLFRPFRILINYRSAPVRRPWAYRHAH